MTAMKKIWKFLSSMRFAIILLVILAAACAIASLVPQGEDYAYYARRYSERVAGLILALRLDDAFHSGWFIAINAFLVLNLLACNLTRLPQLIRRTKAEGDPVRALEGSGDVSAEGVADPLPVFRKLGLSKPASVRTAEGREALFASKHRAGLWGAWVCHLGILLLILGFGLGQMTQKVYTVYGVPGDSKPIEGTELALTIDDFRVELREDDTVAQYTADITVRDLSEKGIGQSGSAEISVNNPAKLFGMKFYQNSTGWAAKVNVLKDGEPLQEKTLCTGEYLALADKPELVILFRAFYPDYVLEPGTGPATASGALKNPAYLYQAYYQEQLLGMNVLMGDEPLTIDEYTITFTEPQTYTLIQIKEDHFTPLALAGGLLTLLGLLLALYIQPVKVWAVRDGDAWTVRGQSHKGGAIFRERFTNAIGTGKESLHATD